MEIGKAKETLLTYSGKDDICNIFMKKGGNMSTIRMNQIWNDYLDFMIIKTLASDVGSHTEMKYSASPLIDELWHCHVLCTLKYKQFMKLINKVNPLVNFIHHSLELSFSSDDEKMKRRQATINAYKYVFVFLFDSNNEDFNVGNLGEVNRRCDEN